MNGYTYKYKMKKITLIKLFRKPLQKTFCSRISSKNMGVYNRFNFRQLLLTGKRPPETKLQVSLHGNEMKEGS